MQASGISMLKKRWVTGVLVLAALAFIVKCCYVPDLYCLGYFKVSDDVLSMWWNTLHFKQAVLQGKPWFYSSSILAPEGVSLFSHAYTPVFGLAHLLTDHPVLAINVVVWLNLTSFAFGVYVLSGRWLRVFIHRFLVAVIAVFNGYLLAKGGIHINLVLLGLVPWPIWCILESMDDRGKLNRPVWLIPGAVLLFANWLFDFYAIFYIVLFLFFRIIYLRFLDGWFTGFTLKKGLIAGLLILALHVLSRLLYISGLDKRGGIWEAADIREFFIPGPLGYWWHSERTYTHSPETENFMYAGLALLSVLVLTLISVYRKGNSDRETRFFIFLAAAFFSLMFPVLRLEGKNLFFMPTSLIHYVPVIDNFRAPSRLMEMFLLASVLLVFRNAEIQGWHARRGYAFLLAALLLLFTAEHAVRPKKFIGENALQPFQADMSMLKNRTVLSIPFGVRDGLKIIGTYNTGDFRFMSVPGCKSRSGYISRIPEHVWKRLREDAILIYTLKWQSGATLTTTELEQWQQALTLSDIQVIRIEEGMLTGVAGHRLAEAMVSGLDGWKIFGENGVSYAVRIE